nr:DUF2178 domain-containing protein [uncultured Methanolobus sp.]
MNIDKYNLRFLETIAILFLLGLTLWYLEYYGIGFCLIIVSLTLTVMFLYVSSKPREYFIRDERSVLINEKAGYHAFWILIMSMAILVMVDWHTELLYKEVSSLLYIIAMLSWSILRWYYDKKGFEQNP